MLSLLFTKKYHSLLPKSKPILGRWAVQEVDKLVFRKIDLANEDHCGCCIQEKPLIEEKNDKYLICDDDIICVDFE